MTEAEIIESIQRGLRAERAREIKKTVISATITQGIYILGFHIKRNASWTLKTRTSLSSNTNIFAEPTNCKVLHEVWDMETNAIDITGATNASPIVITAAAHGREDDDIITVHDVGGNTAADGTWKVANKATDTLELYGSDGTASGVYTSGGKLFKETTEFSRLEKIPEAAHSNDDETRYFLRPDQICVDKTSFTNDLIIEYTKAVTALTDVPTEYHQALVAWGVIYHTELPKRGEPNYADINFQLKLYQGIWDTIIEEIKSMPMKSTASPGFEHIPNVKKFI